MTPREAFEAQAMHCDALGSPFMGRLMRLLAAGLRPGAPVADRVLGWPGDPSVAADSLPLRLGGALHALALSGDPIATAYPPNEVDDTTLWAAVDEAMARRSDTLLDGLTRAPQTNEVRRSVVILAVLHHLANRFGRPFDLLELGTSGGLNLRADRFAMRIGGREFGDRGSPVVFEPTWSGPLPPDAVLTVRHRRGVDVSPVDPTSDAGRLRLLSYIWPDQPDRMARTAAAIEIARQVPAEVTAADAADWLAKELERPAVDHARLIFHTVAWQYFPPETQAKARAAIEAAGAAATDRAPVFWLGMENMNDGEPGAVVTLRLWPGNRTLDLGRADYHGRWVRWNAAFADLA